eukprot:CAMPEP_0174743058 /NCGR_PEP_ID=MMETSP1094-20130205/80622_1 /TAXON_ID=156173 /ORGANISM="Chrysochromulina brevifilum, Strain UTEX LB 985" /LENGTH=32 /DNA_ID= /DNA_START= /DNA_END= /DNA_ORIENTATION=
MTGNATISMSGPRLEIVVDAESGSRVSQQRCA